jgi:hypothetical protein
MGGVDITNQLRAVYETHQKAWHSWWPLFYWCLDTALVNAYRISHIIHVKRQLPQITHSEFREALYKELFIQGRQEQKHKYEYESKLKLKPGLKDDHKAIQGEKQQYCHWYKLQEKKQHGLRISQTHFTCQLCHIPLCKPGLNNCWKAFHSQKGLRTPLSEQDINII